MSTSFFPKDGYECLDNGPGTVCAGLSSLTDGAVFRVEILDVPLYSGPYQLCVGGAVDVFGDDLSLRFVAEEDVDLEDALVISETLTVYVLTFQGSIYDFPSEFEEDPLLSSVAGFVHPYFGIFRKPLAVPGGPVVSDCLSDDAAYVSGFPLLTECNDGIDNDLDGDIDFVAPEGFFADADCSSSVDKSESS